MRVSVRKSTITQPFVLHVRSYTSPLCSSANLSRCASLEAIAARTYARRIHTHSHSHTHRAFAPFLFVCASLQSTSVCESLTCMYACTRRSQLPHPRPPHACRYLEAPRDASAFRRQSRQRTHTRTPTHTRCSKCICLCVRACPSVSADWDGEWLDRLHMPSPSDTNIQ